MSLTYKYAHVDRNEYGETHIPAIPITLIGSKEQVSILGLVDSGADLSAIPMSIALVLGLNVQKPSEAVGGIGGSTKAVLTIMDLQFGKGHEHYKLKVPVYAVEEGDEIGVLLGRQDLFDKFKITFVQKDHRLQFKRNAAEGEKH
ncbi:MAG: hypothetical protein GOV15_03140 [Candidatus Diapherotrites archaeon]|nr:hypothetical protein [Candidatus Diapherotrites archaeon]